MVSIVTLDSQIVLVNKRKAMVGLCSQGRQHRGPGFRIEKDEVEKKGQVALP